MVKPNQLTWAVTSAKPTDATIHIYDGHLFLLLFSSFTFVIAQRVEG